MRRELPFTIGTLVAGCVLTVGAVVWALACLGVYELWRLAT